MILYLCEAAQVDALWFVSGVYGPFIHAPLELALEKFYLHEVQL